jgi:hypothetical protein
MFFCNIFREIECIYNFLDPDSPNLECFESDGVRIYNTPGFALSQIIRKRSTLSYIQVNPICRIF